MKKKKNLLIVSLSIFLISLLSSFYFGFASQEIVQDKGSGLVFYENPRSCYMGTGGSAFKSFTIPEPYRVKWVGVTGVGFDDVEPPNSRLIKLDGIACPNPPEILVYEGEWMVACNYNDMLLNAGGHYVSLQVAPGFTRSDGSKWINIPVSVICSQAGGTGVPLAYKALFQQIPYYKIVNNQCVVVYGQQSNTYTTLTECESNIIPLICTEGQQETATCTNGNTYVKRICENNAWVTQIYQNDPCAPVCTEVIVYAKNSDTNECREFSNSCIPEGWIKVNSCPPETKVIYKLKLENGEYLCSEEICIINPLSTSPINQCVNNIDKFGILSECVKKADELNKPDEKPEIITDKNLFYLSLGLASLSLITSVFAWRKKR